MCFPILLIIFLKLAVLAVTAGGAVQASESVIPEQSKIKINKIEVEGNTVFNDSELEAIVAPLEGKEIPLGKILELRDKLTTYYIRRGYKNSGAFLPPQKLTDGNIEIKIIEGSLAAIEITGLSNLTENYIKSRLPNRDQPLNFHHLSLSLERLQNDPLIKKISAEIKQQSVGKNILLLELEENPPLTLGLAFTNAYSPSIGSYGGQATITHQNFWGFGDRLNLNHSQTQGLARTGVSYSFPFNSLDGRISFSYDFANSEIIEDELKDFDINADYESFYLKIEQPIISTRTEKLSLGLGIEHKDSETFILSDLSFAFTDGLSDGRSRISVLRFTQDYIKNGTSILLTGKSQFNVGFDAFDATKTQMGIDGIFWSWSGEFQCLVALNKNKDLVLATAIMTQFTPSQLLPIEQFTLGGVGKVRGYRTSIGVADNGVSGTIQLQIPLISPDWGKLQIIPFFDLGTIWNNKRETIGSNTLASVGLGLRYKLKEGFEARIDYGIPLIALEGLGETGTENRLTFFLSLSPFKF